MCPSLSPRLRAVLQALLVTFLWSTSIVLIKTGLKDIPALTFAGLRYTLAFLCLLPFALRPAHRSGLRRLPPQGWARLVGLGLLYYTATQGAQFVSLSYLPAVTANILLNFTPIVVALMGIPLLRERPTAVQWGGVLASLAGAMIFFYPLAFPQAQAIGYAAAVVGLLANAGSAVLGRRVNRDGDLHPLAVTVVSMGIGAAILLGTGVAIQGMPQLSLTHWALIGWLAVVNTAIAFTLWNHTLRTLSAMESSIINNTMLIQIAVLAWVFLGEQLTLREIAGLALAGFGVLVVQLRRIPGLPRPARSGA